MEIDPESRTITTKFDSVGNGFQLLHTFINVPDLWFSFDQAGIDPTVSTRSYAGIFATHRNAGASQVYSFDEFSVIETITGGGPVDFQFDRWTFPVPLPTAMVFGPDGRLYVTELFGTIHAFTLDHVNHVVLDDEIIDTVRTAHGGDRLTLGITVDPGSTPEDVILWVSHSNGSVNNGEENSGIVSRLSGPNFLTIEDRITGLPRAIANHAMNEIHFSPDGKLYIAAGGNTGAGAANTELTEFGERSEQPLSAGILVADVNAPGFSGDCATPVGNSFIPATCDVEVYASGLRNSYDFEFHKNGSMYATDNGLGITGTYPPSPTPPCTLFGDANLHNPGSQPDLLHRIIQGKYYGHPNPFRDVPFGPECVFKDGSFQGVAPLPNFELPLLNLGNNKSANGIMEYKADTFFSKLMGRLLITNFSTGDDITQVLLSDDGLSVLNTGSMVGGFIDPLPIEEGPGGVLYVGEINAFQITVLVPLPLAPEPNGFWTNHQVLPEPVLDPGGVGLDGKLYVVSGKTTGSVYVPTLRIYDSVTNSWTTGPDLPGPGVEDVKVVAMDGKIYAVGGGTHFFTDSVANFAVYDPATNLWTSLAPMSQGRGGPVAEVINGKIYVAGGRDPLGNSVNTAEVYDPATDTWSAVAPMATRRDNAGSATFNGKLYVFGGRILDAGGVTIDGELNTMEIYDPATDTWSPGAPMPTGRRAMIVGKISGRAQVMGGENNGGQAFPQNEEYNPVTNTWRTITTMQTPRHGMAAGTINGKVYTAGGGVVAGSSFSDVVDSFRY
jgi:N-acetylneuraminic acid mutarotase